MLLTVVSAAVTYFISKYNVAIDSSMVLNTIHTDSTEVGQLMSLQMIPYVVFLMFVPAVMIFSIDIKFTASGKYLLALVRARCHRLVSSQSHPCTRTTTPFIAPATCPTNTSCIRWCPSMSLQER